MALQDARAGALCRKLACQAAAGKSARSLEELLELLDPFLGSALTFVGLTILAFLMLGLCGGPGASEN